MYSVLRQLGHLSSPYIDNSYLQGEDYDRCLENIIDTVQLVYTLGFVVHPEKFVLIPAQRLTFVGFILDSILMRNFSFYSFFQENFQQKNQQKIKKTYNI